MSIPTRLVSRASHLCRAASSSASSARHMSVARENDNENKINNSWPQRTPRSEYYNILLRDPPPYAIANATATVSPTTAAAAAATTTTNPPPPSPPPPPRTYDTIASRTAFSGRSTDDATTSKSPEERARVIFGSRLLSPARQRTGVSISQRPEEPDNCCMSGCVHCVWDQFREEMEAWTAQQQQAQQQQAQNSKKLLPANSSSSSSPPPSTTTTHKDTVGDGDLWADNLFQNVPVGIREFMKQEKRLKEKHRLQGTSGG